MAEIRRTVSFRVESAPSSGDSGLDGHSQRLTVPRTAPVKTRPGILRSPSNTIPVEISANEILKISGQKLSNIPPTENPPASHTAAAHDTKNDHKSDPAKVAADLRLTTSRKMYEEVKCLRYEASKIRETLLKIEEEVCKYEIMSSAYIFLFAYTIYTDKTFNKNKRVP